MSEPVDLVFGTVLCEADVSLQYAYFPLTSLRGTSLLVINAVCGRVEELKAVNELPGE